MVLVIDAQTKTEIGRFHIGENCLAVEHYMAELCANVNTINGRKLNIVEVEAMQYYHNLLQNLPGVS